MLKRILCATLASGALVLSGSAAAQELKIALIAGNTGPLEAYAKDTEKGFMLGLEYLTNGTRRSYPWSGATAEADQL